MGLLGTFALTPFPWPKKPLTDQSADQIRGELNQLGKAITGHDADASLHTVTTTTTGVTTSAVAITAAIAHSGYVLVNGDNGAGNAFVDQVAWNPNGSAVAVSSTTVDGTPAARTYSMSGGALRVQMASGTYTIVTVPIVFTT